jgi:signal transduction histidine kinase
MTDFTFITPEANLTNNLTTIGIAEVQAQQRQLISNISHELRTPLTLVYGYMQSIYRRRENLTDLQKSALEVAIFEMKHTIDLLQESLDLARLDNHSIALSLTSVQLNILVSDLVLEAIATLEKVGQGEIQKIIVEGEMNISVWADGDYLKQVLSRLIDNAIRYSDTVVTIKLEKLDNYISISICDRGCGISAQDQLHIFDPFFRVDRSRNRLTGGVGLGLAIAKVLVEEMGGTLTVSSEIGLGSIFKVMLKSSIEIS